MYRYKEKKGKKKERSRNFSQFSCLRNARTFKLLSLRVRCIAVAFFVCKNVEICCNGQLLLAAFSIRKSEQIARSFMMVLKCSCI